MLIKEASMNQNTFQQHGSSVPAASEGDGQPNPAGVQPQISDAPLVDAALAEVAERDDSLAAQLSDEINALRAEIDSLKVRAGETASRALVSVNAVARINRRAARRVIGRSPWASLCLAAGVGYVLGCSTLRKDGWRWR
ncbi:hypothetical protein [Agrobacterium pusense]|uniref:hypothetical protein n=1 Tax=Agrobacterium pusense TaxID=648995 RepID=UPI0005C9B94D|nr:hypothetical protein [Agrobacterium pusense]KIV66201.1 hypothetical protein SZ54_1554 [Rhizobium sp. UR51a]